MSCPPELRVIDRDTLEPTVHSLGTVTRREGGAPSWDRRNGEMVPTSR